jgi:hypothetical protein
MPAKFSCLRLASALSINTSGNKTAIGSSPTPDRAAQIA